MSAFPEPERLSRGCSRWRLSDLERYEAEVAGRQAPERAPSDEVFLSDRQVAERYNVSRFSIWRWCRNQTVAA